MTLQRDINQFKGMIRAFEDKIDDLEQYIEIDNKIQNLITQIWDYFNECPKFAYPPLAELRRIDGKNYIMVPEDTIDEFNKHFKNLITLLNKI